MVRLLKHEFSICAWYPLFTKDSLQATIIPIPNEVLQYLEHDAFLMPLEAINESSQISEWSDGSPIQDEEYAENQPTFPEFSKMIQDAIDEYGAVFIKSNWSAPSDAIWVAPTKTLKCKTLEEIYLLLKSSDNIAKDLNTVKYWAENDIQIQFSLVLKQWRDINPCTEFRCFILDNELIAISQRDISQYHSYNEAEKYNIQMDIKSLFMERIKGRFPLSNYSVDVVRWKKDKVKVVDFGPMDEDATSGTLFTYDELHNCIHNTPEFRFIGEEIGVQPKDSHHMCIPQEVNEFLSGANGALIDVIRKEVEKQNNETVEVSLDPGNNI